MMATSVRSDGLFLVSDSCSSYVMLLTHLTDSQVAFEGEVEDARLRRSGSQGVRVSEVNLAYYKSAIQVPALFSPK
jgi:hypothetical protein